MKKITAILIMFLYLLPTLGFSVKAHYCGNRLASVSFNSLNDRTCVCGNKKMEKKCCTTKTFSFQVDDSEKQQELIFDFDGNFKIQPEAIVLFTLLVQPSSTEQSSVNKQHSYPPDPVKLPLYLSYQVFRI